MIEHVLPLIGVMVAVFFLKALLLAALIFWIGREFMGAIETLILTREWPKARWFTLIVCIGAISLLAACDAPINPVKYQTVEVLVTRPCFAGRTPPTPAAQLTEPVCAGSDAECVRAAKADILELQREAREFRNLFKECSK